MIGILGGMGSYATLAFFQKVLDLQEKEASKHIPLFIYNDVSIPSRVRHILFDEASPVPLMREAIIKMQSIGCSKIYIPCNSASYFIDEIKKDSAIKIDIIGTILPTIKYLPSEKKKLKRVMFIGSHIIYVKKPFAPFLSKFNFEQVEHDDYIQNLIEEIIYGIKDNSEQKIFMERAKNLLKLINQKYKIDILVLACTELCLAFDQLNSANFKIIDTNFILAKTLVENYMENK